MSYQVELSKRFFDHPPTESREEKYGIWFDEIDLLTLRYLLGVEIKSEQDELAFYARMRNLAGGALLGCVVGHKVYQAFVDFEEYIQEYLTLTDDEKEADARECFSYHGLNQHLFFQYIAPDIEEWKNTQCPRDLDKAYSSIHYVYPELQRPKYYNIGHIRGFSGVQMDDDDDNGGMDFVDSVRLNAGADCTSDEEMPQNSYPDDQVEEEFENMTLEPDVDVKKEAEQLSVEIASKVKQPILTTITDEMLQFVEAVKQSDAFQKTVEQHQVEGNVYAYVAERSLKIYGTVLPDTSLEKYIVGRCLEVQSLEEKVPPDIGEVAPELKDMTVKRCLDTMMRKARKYIFLQAKTRRPLKIGAKRRILDTKPAADPAGIDPGETEASE